MNKVGEKLYILYVTQNTVDSYRVTMHTQYYAESTASALIIVHNFFPRFVPLFPGYFKLECLESIL